MKHHEAVSAAKKLLSRDTDEVMTDSDTELSFENLNSLTSDYNAAKDDLELITKAWERLRSMGRASWNLEEVQIEARVAA